MMITSMMNPPPGQAQPDDSAEQLRRFLAGRDVACPQCEYNLRDLKVPRCPECGEDLVLRVNLAEPKLRLLITGLIALAAGAGLNGLLLIFLVIQLLRSPYSVGGVGASFSRSMESVLLSKGAFWLFGFGSGRGFDVHPSPRASAL
jgi:hypothetical protein